MVDYLEQLLQEARTAQERDEEEETLPILEEGHLERVRSGPDGREKAGAQPPQTAGHSPEALSENAGTDVWRAIDRGVTLPSPAAPGAPVGGVAETLLEQAQLLLPSAGESTAAQLSRTAVSAPVPEARPGGKTGEENAGLRMLYHQVRAETWRENAVQKAGVAVTRESALPEAGLTMGQLDRAMRRDSRRYDGGMSIYWEEGWEGASFTHAV